VWIPRWLGEAYSRLYVELGTDTFRLADVVDVLGVSDSRARVIVHHLHRRGVLTVFERGRPRLYRLLSPENFVLLASGRVRRIQIPQERYVQLIYDCFRAVDRLLKLRSFVVYGSVARGEASPTSDLDILVVSDELEGSLGERVERLLRSVKREVAGELRFLRERGYYTLISLYPLRGEEAERLPLVMLDMVEDAVVVYDEGGFFEGLVSELRRRLAELGARRLRGAKGPFWDLKPDFRPLEVVPL